MAHSTHMKIKRSEFLILSLAIILFALACNVRAEDENPEDKPLPKRVKKIHIPRNLTQFDSPTNFYYVTLTNAGHYKFIVNKKRVYTVVNGFPFSIEPFEMRRGDKWKFTLPRNYEPYTIVFIDMTNFRP